MYKSRLISHILPEQIKYVKYDQKGKTSVVNSPDAIDLQRSFISQSSQIQKQNKHCYRKVHFDSKKQLFKTVDWRYDILRMGQQDDRIIMKRLIRLYQKNYRPQFFKQNKQNYKKQYNPKIPKFIYEIELLPINHIKSFFLNQDYTEDGIYEITINEDGRFRTIIVDDQVPVFQNTDQHIWDISQPWKMILVKAWALINKGYLEILQGPSFRFIQYFSNSNWKYFNLEKQSSKFIEHYNNKIDFAEIILQAKNSQQVRRIGLIPNSCFYKIKNFIPVVILGKKQTQYDVEIQTCYKHRWQGELSIASQRIGQRTFKDRKQGFQLQGNFYATQNQFKNLFNCAYITSTRDKRQYVSDYYKLTFQSKCKRAIYLSFTVKKKGFLDFSLIQSHQNKKKMTNKSFIKAKQYKQDMNKEVTDQRYLKCKYMLIRDNGYKGNQMRRLQKQSKIEGDDQNKKYQVYQIQYLKGYNKGQASFLNIEQGRYYLRIKSEYIQKDSIYYLNYSCHQAIQIHEQDFGDELRNQIFNEAIISMSVHSPSFSEGRQIVYLGNHFQSIGYGYIVIKCKDRNRIQELLVQIDPKKFKECGYQFKDKNYQESQNKFSILIHKGESVAIVLKKIEEAPKYIWPPQGFQIFKNLPKKIK